MVISKEELQSLFPRNNYVLVQPVYDMNKIKTGKTILFTGDTSWKPEHHAQVICKVITRPLQLIYSEKKKMNEYSMEWETEMNLKAGDKIWVDYLAALNAEKKYHVVCENIKYYFIKYENIFLVKRGNRIIMLNGYILISPYQKKIKRKIILPDTLKKKDDNDEFGIVKRIGEPNFQYRDERYYDDDYLCVKDKVRLAFDNNQRLENENHRILYKKEMIVTQRRFLMGII